MATPSYLDRTNWLGLVLRGVLGPSPRLGNVEEGRTARLFSALILIHILTVAVVIPVTNAFYQARTHQAIWNDQDLWVVIAGLVVMIVAYGLLRSGKFRLGIGLYILTTAAVALLAPFVPDPNAEIGILASAIIPVLLSAIVFSTWWVIGILCFIVATATVLLLVSPLPTREAGTGFALMTVVATAGILILAFKSHLIAVERTRLSQISASEEKYRNLFETVTDGIFLIDLKGRFSAVNAAACDQLGYTREELISMPVAAVTGRADFSFGDVLTRLRERGGFNYRTTHRRKDGATLPVNLSLTLMQYDGAPHVLGVARDVSRTEAEMVFKQAVIDNVAEGLCVYHEISEFPHALFTLWNHRMIEITGYTMDEINRLGWYQTVYPDPDLQARARSRMESLRRRDNLRSEEWPITGKDGQVRILEISTAIIEEDAGTTHVLALMHDITERKRAEDVLANQFSNSPDIILIVDQSRKVEKINRVPTGSSFTTETLRGMDAIAILPSEFQGLARQALDLCFESGTTQEIEHRISDGTWVRARIAPLLHGRVTERVMIISTDITERKRAGEALRESEAKYRALIETTNTGFVILDRTGRVLDANPEYVRLSGHRDLGEISGRSIIEWTAQDDRERNAQALGECLKEGSTRHLEVDYVDNDGKITPIEIDATAVEIDGVIQILTICRDITARKRLDDEKGRLEAELQQAQKMETVGQLAGGVAHDFNNMLGAILGLSELAIEQVDPSQPIHADLLEIERCARRSVDLTRRLLTFARKQTITPKVLDLNDTMSGMLKMLQRLIGENIELCWRPQADLWPVLMDTSQIDQILTNLCVNARDAIADAGKISIETGNITFDENHCAGHPGHAPGQYVRLAVGDNGCGMTRETLGFLFEPFFTTKAVGKGTGLGLATVLGIVKQNYGFIDVDSEQGSGTTFTIYLPRHVGKAEQLWTEAGAKPASRGHETILLVEDESAVLRMTARILTMLGYDVLPVGSPGEAIHLAKERIGEIHLLMTDVVMPEMNGRDLAKNLLSVYPNLKRLFMSGYAADVIAHHGVLDEGVHFIQKPFSVADLAAKTRAALGRESTTIYQDTLSAPLEAVSSSEAP